MLPTKPLFAALVGAVAVALALAGCSGSAGAAQKNAATDLSVVATTTQVADFTRNVVGDTTGVTVTELIQPNQSAHSYDPSAADLTALGSADVLVINGVGLESWLDDAIDASGFHGVRVNSSAGITIAKSPAGNDEGPAEGPAGGGAGGHDSGNPHIWMDVHNAEAMVATIATKLAAADTAHAASFEANAAAYSAKLAQLDTWIRSNIDTVPAKQRLLVSNHDALGYFTAAYGITYIGSVIPSFDDNAEPSAAQIDDLVRAIKKTGVKAVFSEASVNAKTAKTIATEAGVRVYSGDDALYVDSLGPKGSAGATYLSTQLHNVTLMLSSWGATPSPAPAELEVSR